jgi:hypothetical protein
VARERFRIARHERACPDPQVACLDVVRCESASGDLVCSRSQAVKRASHLALRWGTNSCRRATSQNPRNGDDPMQRSATNSCMRFHF